MKKTISSLLVLSALVGCAPVINEEKKQTGPTSAPTSNQSAEDYMKKIKFVEKSSQIGSGELTKENIAVGGIHIGDSRETVMKLLGEPTTKSILHSTPFPLWYYEKHNLYIAFYSKGGPDVSPDAPAGGVVQITVNEPSDIKTDREFGVGSRLKEVMKNFQRAYAYKKHEETQTQNIIITGSNKSADTYYPTLQIILKNDKVTSIELTNQEEKP